MTNNSLEIMLKLVLFLQVVILIVFGIFGIVVFQQAQIAGDNLDEALVVIGEVSAILPKLDVCLLYTSPSPRDQRGSRMPSSA